MAHYSIIAKVDQVVTREVQFLVEAGSEERAIDKAKEALEVYPEPVEVSGMKRIVVNKAHYWIPRNVEVVAIKQEEEPA